MNFAKVLRTPFFIEHLRRLLLIIIISVITKKIRVSVTIKTTSLKVVC